MTLGELIHSYPFWQGCGLGFVVGVVATVITIWEGASKK